MNEDEIAWASAAQLAAAIRTRNVSAVEVMSATLKRAERVQRALNCFITICAAEAMRDARAADERLARGEPLGPLHGVPLHVKDLVNTAGVRTTFGSLMYEHNVPKEDAVAVARLKAAGAILMGKTTTPEFGHMPYTEAPLFGRTANPYDTSRTAGGSSGGAAAACAAGAGPLAIATDAGGSTRIPAACCGLVGFKQSLGLVPHDMAPEAFGNLSYITPTTRTVVDTALMLEAMAGPHPSDPHSHAMRAEGLVDAARGEGTLVGLRVGWRPYLGNTIVDREVLARAEEVADTLGDLGAIVEPMGDDMEPTEPFWLVLSTALWNARFSDKLAEWRDRMSPTLVRQMAGGKAHSAELLARALLQRTTIFRRVQGWFERFDVILTPTLTRTALPIEERLFEEIDIEGKPAGSIRKAWYPYTHPFNLTGHPAVTLPAGLHSDGLPIAVQLIGRRGADGELLRVAAHLERARPWAHIRPALDGLA